MHRPSQTDHLPWPRFWSPRKSRAHGTSGEFFEDPQGVFGKHLHPQAATLPEITPETGLLVLCGEPGLGKTTELDLLRESLPASFGENERLIDLEARTFESFPDLQGHLDSHPDWQAWLSNQGRLTILFDGLDEGLIRMPTLVARLRSFLETKPTERLRLVLSCRSFEWPEAQGERLASLWTKRSSVFVMEPGCILDENAWSSARTPSEGCLVLYDHSDFHDATITELLHERLAADSKDGDHLIQLKITQFGSFADVQNHLERDAIWKRWHPSHSRQVKPQGIERQ